MSVGKLEDHSPFARLIPFLHNPEAEQMTEVLALSCWWLPPFGGCHVDEDVVVGGLASG